MTKTTTTKPTGFAQVWAQCHTTEFVAWPKSISSDFFIAIKTVIVAVIIATR